METATVTLTTDTLGEIFHALQERHNALIESLRNRERPGALIRIEQRQLERVQAALHTIEKSIFEAAL